MFKKIKKYNLDFKRMALFLFIAVVAYFLWSLYIPSSIEYQEVTYTVQKGSGSKEIANDLKERDVIKNIWPFRLYLVLTGQQGKIQAGNYNLSPSMSAITIAKKFIAGDVIKTSVKIFEGQTAVQLAEKLDDQNVYLKDEFLSSIEKDWSLHFDFLADKPKDLNLEGYLFPDTYEIILNENPDILVETMLLNFDKKLSQELRQEIKNQEKTIFEIVTMASILEKEVRILEDKKIVAGLLWKRLENNMLLQVDATVNYITGKSDARVLIKDTKTDSEYNTYKYLGLPKGPISNPGFDSILAAIYSEESPYWYYISAKNGETIFSRTFAEHNIAIRKYLN